MAPNIQFQDGLVKKISEEEARNLEIFPLEDEIKNAVWSCDSSKAPSVDGFNLKFIKELWGTIGKEFTESIWAFF